MLYILYSIRSSYNVWPEDEEGQSFSANMLININLGSFLLKVSSGALSLLRLFLIFTEIDIKLIHPEEYNAAQPNKMGYNCTITMQFYIL